MSDLNVTTIQNNNIAKTDKLLVFNNNESKAAEIQDVVQLVPGVMGVATCNTAGNVATKAVTCDNWNNQPGQSILVEFANENSANNISLSINSGTAIPVYYMNTATEQVSGGAIPAGAVVFTLNAAGNKFYAHVTKYSAGAGIQINGNKIEAVNDLPTDAVLHYSFDEIPDYPDGTADYIRNNNFTRADTSDWTGGNNVCSIQNGKLVISNIQTAYIRMSIGTITNPIIKIKFRLSVDDNDVRIYSYLSSTSSSSVLMTTSVKANEIKEIVFACESIYNLFGFTELPIGANLEIFSVYIGNGSYNTPIIDNANGQNNATNNGGIAVSGVSGKGVYFPSATQLIVVSITDLPVPTSNNNFTISLWINISPSYIADTTSATKGIFAIGSTAGLIGICRARNNVIFVCRDSQYERVMQEPMQKGSWQNYVLSYNGSSHRATIYINGVLKNQLNANLADYTFGSEQTQWEIWGDRTRAGQTKDSINQPATIDDVLFFDRALTEKEVLALYYNKANTPKYYSKADYKLEQIANNS